MKSPPCTMGIPGSDDHANDRMFVGPIGSKPRQLPPSAHQVTPMHWASRLFYHALCTPRPKARRQLRRLRVESLEVRDVPTVLGTAYVDLNLNGVQDIEDLGAAGVTVTATDANGVVET